MAKFLFSPKKYPELTYEDVCLIPNNPIKKRIRGVASPDELKRLNSGIDEQDRRGILLELAEKYAFDKPVSRDGVDLTPNGRLGNTPMLIANMNAVTGARMAEAIARVGGLATIPQDKSDEEVKKILEYLRSRHPLYETPVRVTPSEKIHDFRRLLQKRSHGAAVVTSTEGEFLGVIGEADVAHVNNEDTSIERYYRTSDLVTADDGIQPLEAIELMNSNHVQYLPVKGADGRIVGVLPKRDAGMKLRYYANINPVYGGLRAAFTIGALNNNPLDRVRLLLDLGVYDLQFDTAHADQGTRVYRNVERSIDLAINKGINPDDLNIIVGNVVTREAVRSILLSGAKYVKGGIGPGHACTTRMMTGVGRPQLSMILDCADEAHARGGYLIADGGIRYPRDVSIALAAGADYVMLGSLFAGTYESPSEIQYDEQKRPYKENFGMASSRASVSRTQGRVNQQVMDIFREVVGHRAEGASEQRVHLKEGRESVALLNHYLLDGATSGATYAGARSIREYPKYAIMALQMPSGFNEGQAKTSL